jgi:hypothetical protein
MRQKISQVITSAKRGQFPDESVKKKVTQIYYVKPRRTSNIKHKGDSVRGTIIIVSTVLTYFVSVNLV